MPIQKTKVLSSGVSGNYWVLKGVYVSPSGDVTRAFADLFASAGDAVTGTPLFQEDVVLAGVDNPVGSSALIDLVEAKLVTLPGDFLSGTVV